MSDTSSCSCGGSDHWQPKSRREFMYVGLIGGLGLTLGQYFGMQSAKAGDLTAEDLAPAKEGPAKAVIHIFLPGGMAAQESWDPKPYAPIEYRGPLGTAPTKLTGEVFSEYMKDCSQIADKITVIRSITHGEAAHERGTHNMFTGYRPSPAIQFPSFGSVVSEEFGPRNNMPPYVCIPSIPNEYAGSGYLSSAYGPFSLGSDPAQGGFAVRDLALAQGIDDQRFDRRKSMLSTVDHHFRSMEKTDALTAMDTFYQRAYNLISAKTAREAFNLNAEPDAIKEEYGKTQAGMRMLLARRLVEGGVRFVSMTYGGWDHHSNISNGFKQQMPAFDKAFASLIRDLDRRNMLDSTLVMVSSEFGRTPKINQTSGRDHWPKVFSVVLAGGGFKKGLIYGTSDSIGSEPDQNPLAVEDFAQTIYHQLGINGDKRLMSPGDRPIQIVRGGKVVNDLLA
ncbi:MAG TPA: DUF1501 domain-containing protein [Tepidisphaeraceae bacterium]|nr:DUF1501 domain-containing protein [Tepidisphaeraceae bacterium]